jgi:hypothetical protein
MHALSRIIREFIGLFVDDGGLAVLVLIWIVICGVALQKLLPTAPWQGLILFLGLALILLESVTRPSSAGRSDRRNSTSKRCADCKNCDGLSRCDPRHLGDCAAAVTCPRTLAWTTDHV